MKVHYTRLRRAILNIVSVPSILFLVLLLILASVASLPAHSSNPQQSSPYTEPRWMAKIRANQAGTDSTSSGVTVFANVDVSNEPGPQSETFIAVNTGPLGRFEDKPFIAVDTNLSSPFRDNIYVAWDTVEGFANGIVNLARSTDHGVTFTRQRIDDPNSGSGANEIAAVPAVGPNGEVFVAWLDVLNTRLQIDRSFDGGVTFGRDSTISQMIIPFDTGIPSIKVRRALVYPSIDVDRSNGPHRGRLYCAWTDQADQSRTFIDGAETDIFFAFSDDGGLSWSAPIRIADDNVHADQFYQWLSVDPIDGSVNVSWYDTRNDPTRRKTDIFFARSADGGLSFSPNVRVTSASTDESCPVCEDLIAQTGFTLSTLRFCRRNCDAEIFNQYGDYTGLASFSGLSHPVWTDRRTGERLNEEIFTASVKAKKTK